MKKQSIGIILVNWNGQKDTIACLNSLAGLNLRGRSVTTIIVDNGSSDDSVAVLRSQYPKVKVIALPDNRGFTGANNEGISWAVNHGLTHVWILNNDTLVHKDALSLFDAFSDEKLGAVGSKIYFAPGREYHKDRYTKKDVGRVIWFAGGLIDWKNMYASHRGVDEVDHGQYDRQEETDFITGCSLGIPTSVIRKVGSFDNRYFAYLEDVDLSLRIKRAGFRVQYVPSSVIWHVNASSSGGAGSVIHEYYQTRNRLLLGMRFAPARTRFALMREAVRQMVMGSVTKRKAIIDVMRAHYGAYQK